MKNSESYESLKKLREAEKSESSESPESFKLKRPDRLKIPLLKIHISCTYLEIKRFKKIGQFADFEISQVSNIKTHAKFLNETCESESRGSIPIFDGNQGTLDLKPPDAPQRA